MNEVEYMASFDGDEDDPNEEPKDPASCMTFKGNTSAENINSTNLGGGLYMNNPSAPNQWIIIGIVSSLPHPTSSNCNAAFTNIIFFVDWIQNCLTTLLKSP